MAHLRSTPESRSSTPPPSYFSSLRNKASQFSLRSIHRNPSAALASSSSSTSTTPRQSRASTPSPSLLPTHEHDVFDVGEDNTLRPPTEHTRLFGLGRWGRKSTGTNGQRDYGAAIRLEDDSDYDTLQNDTSADAFGLDAGTAPKSRTQVVKRWFARRPVLRAGLQMGGIFILSTLIMGGTLWVALPTLEEADRPKLKIPKSFEQLQDLNTLLKKYKTIYPFRTLVCFVVVYLFLQAFSLPGSMYLSILGGAVWGMGRALPLCCACVATGATLCYAISAALGPALLTMPKWKAWIDKWAAKIEAQRANLLSFLIVLRIAPLPPHWVVNIAAPHLGIGIIPFWVSTFFGIMGVTVIHTTIGGGLDEMTSAKDFKLISWKNGLGLSGIVVAVLIPVGIRYYFRSDIASIEEAEREEEEEEEGELVGDGYENSNINFISRSSKSESGGGGAKLGAVTTTTTTIGDAVDADDDERLLLEGVIVQSGGPPQFPANGKGNGNKGKGKTSSTPNPAPAPMTGRLVLLDNDDNDDDDVEMQGDDDHHHRVHSHVPERDELPPAFNGGLGQVQVG